MDFIKDLLTAMQIPINPETVAFMESWIQLEGTGARFNPLATTWKYGMDGATAFNYYNGKPNVMNYVSYEQGLKATTYTLKQPFYKNIVAFLKTLKPGFVQCSTVLRNEFTTYGGVIPGTSYCSLLFDAYNKKKRSLSPHKQPEWGYSSLLLFSQCWQPISITTHQN